MLKLNATNIDYLRTMRLCDVIDGCDITSLYYNEKTIKALEYFSDLVGFSAYGDWEVIPNHNKSITLVNDKFFVVIDDKGLIKFIS